MIPNVVIVAGVPYEVQEKEFVVFEDNANALGVCTYDQALIEVKSTMSEERIEEIFIHELFHAILYEAGFEEHDEDLVNRASKVLYQVLKDNNLTFAGEPPEDEVRNEVQMMIDAQRDNISRKGA